jgi:hypothetical protein
MRVRLHIERLVLEGLDVPPSSRDGLRHALEAELTRLVTAGGLAPWSTRGAALAALPVPAIGAAGPPRRLGTAIAGAVYAGLGPTPTAPSARGRAWT